MQITRRGHSPGPFHTSLTKMQGTGSFSWYSSPSKKDTSKNRIFWIYTTSHKNRKVKVMIFVLNFQALRFWPLVAIFDIPFKWPCPNFSMAAEKLSPLKSSLILRAQLQQEKLIRSSWASEYREGKINELHSSLWLYYTPMDPKG